jgi:dihydropteroate synthase
MGREWSSLRRIARLGPLQVGPGFPVRIMAAVNVSPESFYKGSVATGPSDILASVTGAVEQGAEVIDIGAMSTAPYLESEVTEELEKERIAEALRAVKGMEAVISVDTLRASVAELALKRGATIINDVSGLKNDERMASVVSEHGASLLAMAHSSEGSRARPIVQVRESLRRTLAIADRAGIREDSIVLDPGIGFFREEGAGRAYSPQRLMPWHEWDSVVLADLGELRVLGRPLCVGLSRKSFLGKILKLDDPGERLPGSIAATAMAVMNGADMIRTHDVKETVQAVRVVEAVMRRGPRAGRAP